MKNIILILTTLMFLSCSSSNETQPPKWIHSLNNSDKIIEAVGIAESKHESILNVMYDLSSIINSEVRQMIKNDIESTSGNKLDFLNKTIKSTSESLFGKVKIKGLTKNFREESGVGESIKELEYFERVSELTFSDGNKSLIYKNFTEESAGKESSIKHHFEMVEQNCTLKDLIDELNSVGCEFEFYSDNYNHYALVKFEKERLLENIKNNQ